MRKSSSNFKFVNILLNYISSPLICMQIYFLPYILRYKPRLVILYSNTRVAKSLIANLRTTKARGVAHPPLHPIPWTCPWCSFTRSFPLDVLDGDVITRLTGVESSVLHKMILGCVTPTSLTFIGNDPWSNMYTAFHLGVIKKKISRQRSINFN